MALLNDGDWDALRELYHSQVDVRQADICELRNGRIVRMTLGYTSTADALKAVGLAE